MATTVSHSRDGGSMNPDVVYEADQPVFANKPVVGPVYAKLNNGDEYYPSSGDRAVLIHRDGKPVYARDSEGRQIYPVSKDGDEYVIEELGPIRDDDGSVRYPLDKSGNPIYPQMNGRFYYYEYKHIGVDRNGEVVYLRSKNGAEMYPSAGTFGRSKNGDPIYCQRKNGFPIFPKSDATGERYLMHDRDLDDWIWMRDGSVLKKYAKDINRNEFYPRRAVGQEGMRPLLTEKILNNKYATLADGRVVYPLDEYGNEHTITPTDTDDLDAVFPLGYPVTNDNFYIVPRHEDKPLLSSSIDASIGESNLVAKIYRRETGFHDYLTNVRSKRKSRAPSAKKYKTNLVSMVSDEAPLATSNASGKTGKPVGDGISKFYCYLLMVLAAVLVLVGGALQWLKYKRRLMLSRMNLTRVE